MCLTSDQKGGDVVKEVRLAIVVSRFNFDKTYMMLQRVLFNTEPLGAEVKVMVEVP